MNLNFESKKRYYAPSSYCPGLTTGTGRTVGSFGASVWQKLDKLCRKNPTKDLRNERKKTRNGRKKTQSGAKIKTVPIWSMLFICEAYVLCVLVCQHKALQGIDLQMLTVPCGFIGSQLNSGRLVFGILAVFWSFSSSPSEIGAPTGTETGTQEEIPKVLPTSATTWKTKRGPGRNTIIYSQYRNWKLGFVILVLFCSFSAL